MFVKKVVKINLILIYDFRMPVKITKLPLITGWIYSVIFVHFKPYVVFDK